MNKQSAWLIAAALTSLAACGKSEPPAQSTASLPSAAGSAVPAEVAAAPAPPGGLNGRPVDTCAMLDAATAAASLGTLMKEPEAQTAQGSLLGGCNYLGERGMLMLTARPAGEYSGTVEYSSKKGGAKAITDLPGTASVTPAGLMWQPEGKPYFLVIFTVVDGKFDEASALAIARQVKP